MAYDYKESRWLHVKTAVLRANASYTVVTATLGVPSGYTLLDIWVVPEVLWTASTASLVVGDSNSSNGWFTTTNLVATDLILGERLQASQAVAGESSYGGGVVGAYLTTAGRFGQQSTNCIGGYCVNDYNVKAVVTSTTPTSVGTTRVMIMYARGLTVKPVKS